jgi:hypothetical protein
MQNYDDSLANTTRYEPINITRLLVAVKDKTSRVSAEGL